MKSLPKKDYTYGEQLLLEGVKSTYGIPTVGLLAAGFLGFKFVVPKVEWFLKETQDALDEIGATIEELYADAIFRAKATKAGVVVPITTFSGDAKACFSSALVNLPVVGRTWIPTISESRFVTCMIQKGYLDSTIQAFLSR